MNIRILCVGKLKEQYWRDAIAEYTKRLKPYCNLTIEEIKESGYDNVEEEGSNILKRIKEQEHVIVLAIQGHPMSSEELAKNIGRLGMNGRSQIVFVIGGSEGLSEEVYRRGNEHLSFSKMTFPHQMMRVILIEQIYRGYKIIRNEAYHK